MQIITVVSHFTSLLFCLPLLTKQKMSVCLFSRTIARRAVGVGRTLQTAIAPQSGAIRFSSTYYTAGKGFKPFLFVCLFGEKEEDVP